MDDTLNLMKALSDKIRVRIINILFYSDLYVCEMVDILKLPQSTVSRHLTIMKNLNVIENIKEGAWVKYSISKKDTYKSIINKLIENELIDDKQCIKDFEMLKERIKHSRGCEDDFKL